MGSGAGGRRWIGTGPLGPRGFGVRGLGGMRASSTSAPAPPSPPSLSPWKLCILLACVFSIRAVSSLRFELPARHKLCLYELAHEEQIWTGSFVVLPAGLDIEFSVKEPSTGRSVFASQGGLETFRFTAAVEGSYEFCFSTVKLPGPRRTIIFDHAAEIPPELDPRHNDASHAKGEKAADRTLNLAMHLYRTSAKSAFHARTWSAIQERNAYELSRTERNVQVSAYLECLLAVGVLMIQIVFLWWTFQGSAGMRKAMPFRSQQGAGGGRRTMRSELGV